MKLVIGDKNLSSWSMRAWLAVKQSQLPFEEVLVRLDRPNSKAQLKALSPSGLVPCLIDGDLSIWDSLAICEYVAELAPQRLLWPEETAIRAMARSYTMEMHSGFAVMRMQLSMDIQLRTEIRHLTPQTIADIERVLFLWTSALKVSTGPFLFGEFGIVDAFYAPVVFRFRSYGIQIHDPLVLGYMKRIEELPLVQEWVGEAVKESSYLVEFGPR